MPPSWEHVDVGGGAKRDGEFQARLDLGLSGATRRGGNLMRANTLTPCTPYLRAVFSLEVLRIPAKANAVPKGSRTVFRAEAEHDRSVATLAF